MGRLLRPMELLPRLRVGARLLGILPTEWPIQAVLAITDPHLSHAMPLMRVEAESTQAMVERLRAVMATEGCEGCVVTGAMETGGRAPALSSEALEVCGMALTPSIPLTGLWAETVTLKDARERLSRNLLWDDTGLDAVPESPNPVVPPDVQAAVMLQHMLDENGNYGYTCTYG